MRKRGWTFAALVGCFTGGCGSSSAIDPASAPDSDVDAGGTADVGPPDTSAVGTLGAPCDKPGALACAGHAQKLQLICDGGVWKSNGVCAGSQICDTRPGPTSGSCQDADPACAGKAPNASFCEGAVRRTCGPDLVTSTKEACASADHCAAATGAACAKCLDGTFVCEGALLKKCTSDRTAYALADTCASNALCVATDGKCLPPACAAGEYRCNGDTLQTCLATRVGWDSLRVCPTGLCDATAKACLDCAPGSKECGVGNTPRACDASGHWTSLSPCAAPTPLCKGGIWAGVCISGACTAGQDRCNVDTLETCNATFTGFDPVKVCPMGMCDATLKQCDDCKAGQTSCSGATPLVCSSTFRWTSLTPCSGAKPFCQTGVCMACPTGKSACGGACVDLTSDPSNCATCGTACGAGMSCIASTCVTPVFTFMPTGTGATGTIQSWTVPATGTYTMEAWGAQGGTAASPPYVGGKGARMRGDFVLTLGASLSILVGQMGTGVIGSNGGGGGGSFVVMGSTPLLVAGGGGGIRAGAIFNGKDATTASDGVAGSGSKNDITATEAAGGTGGSGGSFVASWGCGGGGFSGDGSNDGTYGTGGRSFLSGGAGGTAITSPTSPAYGGFGGGGAGNGQNGGGGGGGYSGGGGGWIAGAGGSFNAGTNMSNTAGAQIGDGKVVITRIK